jgi:type VI secretion system secreted protein VgrG
VLLAAGQVIASEVDPRDQIFCASYFACQHQITMVLQRPIEFALSSGISIDAGDFESTSGHAELRVRSQLRAIDSSIPYRPARVTPQPVVAGPQTAIVVGPADSEICTDNYGRIKVQFHWDREQRHNEDSSCYVRVAQAWAGAGFGTQFIPRVGQEVLVYFLHGNPDEPLIMGSVYNRDNMPPYAPNEHPTQSGIKTRSSQGGNSEQYNELKFEDQKGSEQLYIRAQRNMDTLVKHDQSIKVLGDRAKTVSGAERNAMHSRTTTVDEVDDLTVKDITINVQRAMDIRCGQASISLKMDGTITITGANVKIGTDDNNAVYSAPGITVNGLKISQTAVGLNEIIGTILKLN